MVTKITVSNGSNNTLIWTGLALVGVVVGGTVLKSQNWQFPANTSQIATINTSNPPQIKTITALGRLEPQGEVIQLSAPTTNSNRVAQLLVKEGDSVKKGQIIAILDSRERLEAAVAEATANVKLAQSQLAITQAGAKQGEIEAQKAEIARLEAQQQGDIQTQQSVIARLQSELENAQTEANRYQMLYQEGAISASDADNKRLRLETAQRSLQEAQAVLRRLQTTSPAQLNQAKATLARIQEVRPVDIQANQAEINRALAVVQQAKVNLEDAYVRSPLNGVILDIFTHAGEIVSNNGIVAIGQTQNMNAIAEVYQSDITRVQIGQKAEITSDSLTGILQGKVIRIDSMVRKQTVVNTDPSANIDGRVIEVQIALDPVSSQKAAKLTNLQVKVVIHQK